MRAFKLLILTIVIGMFCPVYAQKQSLKSMIESSQSAPDEINKVSLLLDICDSLYRTKSADAVKFGTDALDLARKLSYSRGEAYALKYIGLGNYTQGDYSKAGYWFQQALEIFELNKDKKGIANMLSNLGAIYNTEGNDPKALDFFLRAHKMSQEIHDTIRTVSTLINIGLIYSKKPPTQNKAEDYYLKAYALSEKIDYQDGIGTVSFNLGELLFNKAEYKKALDYFQKSLLVFQKSNLGKVPYSLNNIGKIYSHWNDYQNAIKFQEEALDIAKKVNGKLEMALSLIGLGNTYFQKGETQKALKFYKQSEQITKAIGARYELKDSYEGIAKAYIELHDYQKAIQYQNLLSDLKDTIFSIDSQLQISKLQVQSEIESMLKENEILKRDSKLTQARNRQQVLIIFFLLLGLVSVAIFMILLIRANYMKKKANDELAEKNALITAQKQDITDSIHYASRIQNALLPPIENLQEVLPECFIFFRPRDIVSGDFYWFTSNQDRTICIVADCTGHGVPGAFMSMLGIAFLGEIVSRNPGISANEILNEMRAQVVKSLHQNQQTGESKDGMDVALFIFDKNKESLEFAGANNPLLLIRKGELKEYKPDKMPIGIHPVVNLPFSIHELKVEKGDLLYMFSDGYIDQFGGPDGKKFMIKNFKKLLLDIQNQDLHTQKQSIEQRLVNWIGNSAQVDDILVMGIKV